MAGFVKGIVRVGVITALAGGAAAVVAETARPGSVAAIFGQAKTSVASVIDNNIDDPVALRAQLRALEAEYPKKIAEVRADLNEVEEQLGQLDRERAVSEKVVALAAEDLAVLDDGIEQARNVQANNRGAIIRISFDNRALDIEDAYSRRSQIEQTRQTYAVRASEIQTELGYLTNQRDQLAALLTKLETERGEFQAQLFQLDAQIDSISRNERMISMMEDRQKTIDEHSRYRAHSLDQLQTRLARVRGEQQSKLASIASREQTQSYAEQAEWLLQKESQLEAFTIKPRTPASFDRPEVININPLGGGDKGETDCDGEKDIESIAHRAD